MPAGERQRTEQRNPHLQEATLLEALASTDSLAELLTLLHHHAASAAGGESSILFEIEGQGNLLRATSAYGIDRLPSGAWRTESLPPSLHPGGEPIFAPDLSQYMPGLAEHIESVAAVLVPLTHVGLPVGLLVAACAKAPGDGQKGDLALVGHAFALALARNRADIDSALNREARELVSDFSSTVSTAVNLDRTLEGLCSAVNRLFSSGRTSVWLHDRRAAQLYVAASSEPAYRGRASAVLTTDLLAPAAQALHQDRSQMIRDANTAILTIPLRGRRRALGALVLEEMRIDPGTEVGLLDRADEIGLHISSTIENVRLLEEVIRSGRAPDVTADVQLEAERVELRDRLHQSEKLAALGQLVAGIAHELNNPLQAVLGHLELLREGSGLTKPVRRDIQMVYREADRAATIVRNLLVFAGSRKPMRKLTNINALVSRVLSLRSAALRWAGIEVVRHHSEGLPRLKTDPLLLQQALLNIVLNAEQAIGRSGGRIETRTAINQTSDRPLVAVEIRDTGPGIASDVLPRIFEPFYTTKAVGRGTGLGLAIAYGLVQEHGGDITVRNHPDGGAVFTVQLPVETG